MARAKDFVYFAIFLILVVAPLVAWATGSTPITMTWNVLKSNAYSITYGGNCSASRMFFNEVDANFDPDNDGNAAKIPPTPNAVSDNNLSLNDYNYVGITAPSAGPYGYISDVTTLFADPTTLNQITTEFTSDDYINIATALDALYVDYPDATADVFSATQYKFKVTDLRSRIKKLQLNYAGFAFDKGGTTPCIGSATGTEMDLRIYAWNYRTDSFELKTTQNDSQGPPNASTPIPKTLTIDTDIADYVLAEDGSTYFLFVAGPETSNEICLIMDEVDLNVVYYPLSGGLCQAGAIVPIKITNTGTADINVDGNFSSAFSGNDTNIVLKVWQGTGNGCGTYAMGGWEKDCSVTNPQQDLGMTTCRNYNRFNATTNGRLVSNLPINDSNQLCFSGDINGFVRSGTYAHTYQISDFNY